MVQIKPYNRLDVWYVLTYIPKEKRISKATPVSKLGIYLGKTDDVRDGMDISDLEFDFKAQRWVLGGTRSGVVDLQAYPTVFPLRLLPLPQVKGGSTQTLEDFLESTCPWFQHGQIPTGVAVKKGKVASGSAVYEVEKIVDRRSTKSGPKYCVKWKNYPDTDSETVDKTISAGKLWCDRHGSQTRGEKSNDSEDKEGHDGGGGNQEW